MSDETWQERLAAAIRTRDDIATEAKAAAVSTYGPDTESWSSDEWTQVIVVALDMLGKESRAEVARLREALERIAKVDGSVGQGRIRDIARRALTPPTPPVAAPPTCVKCKKPVGKWTLSPEGVCIDCDRPLAGRVARHLEDEPECAEWCGIERMKAAEARSLGRAVFGYFTNADEGDRFCYCTHACRDAGHPLHPRSPK